jgi:hypothetical protein
MSSHRWRPDSRTRTKGWLPVARPPVHAGPHDDLGIPRSLMIDVSPLSHRFGGDLLRNSAVDDTPLHRTRETSWQGNAIPLSPHLSTFGSRLVLPLDRLRY